MVATGKDEWPSLHEVRSLSALYEDDRGLSRDQWKRVSLPDKETLAG